MAKKTKQLPPKIYLYRLDDEDGTLIATESLDGISDDSAGELVGLYTMISHGKLVVEKSLKK